MALGAILVLIDSVGVTYSFLWPNIDNVHEEHVCVHTQIYTSYVFMYVCV